MMKPKRPIDNSAAFGALSSVGALMQRRKLQKQGQDSAVDKTVQLSAEAIGLDITKVVLAIFLGWIVLVSIPILGIAVSDTPQGWIDAPGFIQATLGSWIFVVLSGLVAVVVSIAAPLSIYIMIPDFVGTKMRARVYDINSTSALNAGAMPRNPILGLIYIAIQGSLFFCLVYPFLILQNCYEVFRFIADSLKGKSVSLRGDSGIYYDRIRKKYAELLENGSSRGDAQDMVRCASLGMFTSAGDKTTLPEWLGGKREIILANMIRRHGPIDGFVKENLK